MVIMVVVSRLLADLVETADGYMLRRAGAADSAPADAMSSRKGSTFTLGLALVIFGALAALALFSPWTAGYSPYDQSLRERLASPSLSHLLGTDYVGRDIFSRIVHALRFEFLVSLVALAAVALISVPWGTLAAYLRGRSSWAWGLAREAIMWPVHVLTAFPWIALAALVFAYNFGIPGVEGQPPEPDESTLVFIAALLLVFVPRGVRMCVECFSATPPLLSPLRRAIASMTVLVPMVIAAAVFLSINMGILGLGLVPPRPSLGLIFSEMRDYMGTLALVTLVCVPLVSVLLISSLLLAGEYLLDRMNVRSGRVWSRGIE
jgi:peptide/nickel transport system permease protein